MSLNKMQRPLSPARPETTFVCKREQGSSLIEILVSLVILAVGILGVAALLTSSLKSNQNSYLRTQATLYGFDIIERIRANRAGALAGNYNDPTPSLTANCLLPAGCTAAQLAAHDVAEWEALVSQNLPLGAATVCIDLVPEDGTSASPACAGNPGDPYAIKIWWDDNRDGTANQRLVMSFQP